jgi:DNA-binding transcriptional ArsR family regulator
MKFETKDNDMPALKDRRLAYALEHPLRAEMVTLLSRQQMSSEELAASLGEPPQRVAYHYKVLEQAGGLSAPDRRPPE